MGLIIADSCFNSQEIDFKNKVRDLSEYFFTQNTSIEYWAMLGKGEKVLFGGNFYFWVETIGNIKDGFGLQIEQRTGKDLDCR